MGWVEGERTRWRAWWPPRRSPVASRWRLLSAAAGSAAWIGWGVSVSAAAPRLAVILWLAALLLWGVAFFSPWAVPAVSRSTLVALAIIALAVVPRALLLSAAPFNVSLDEVIHPLLGLAVLRDHPWEIVSGSSLYFRMPNFTHVLQAWPCLFFAPLFGARLASLLWAVVSLLSTYLLARRLFGVACARVAVAMLACSHWHIVYAREAHPFMQAMMLVPLVLFVVGYGLMERHRFTQYVAGILLGASLLAYTSARIVVPLVVLWVTHGVCVRRLHLRDAVAAVAIMVLGAALFLCPYVQQRGVGALLQRYQQTAMNDKALYFQMRDRGWTSAAALAVLARQGHEALRVYYGWGAWLAPHDGAPAPLVDPVSLALALIGLGGALRRLGDGSQFLLLMWIAGTIIFGQMATDVPTAAYRAGPLLPAVAICVGLGVTALARAGQRRFAPWIMWCAGTALALVVLTWNARALHTFFVARRGDPTTALARCIGAASPTPAYYVISSGPAASYEVFRFLGDGRSIRDVPSLMDTLETGIDPTRDAVFLMHPEMTAAVEVIRRCYPAGVVSTTDLARGGVPITAVRVSQPMVAAAGDCALPGHGRGVRARYFASSDWDGPVVRERSEDWPMRWEAGAAAFASAEWAGFLRVPISGTYRFQLVVGKGASGVAAIGSGTPLRGNRPGEMTLTPGVYPIRWRCRLPAFGLCWLRWAPPGSGYTAIPPDAFLTDADGESGASDGSGHDAARGVGETLGR